MCRVYGPKVAALGKKGRAQKGGTCLALAKDFICRHTLSKRQLPPSAQPAAGVGLDRQPCKLSSEHSTRARHTSALTAASIRDDWCISASVRAAGAGSSGEAKKASMFLDENAGLVFFRRLSWSPEGCHSPC